MGILRTDKISGLETPTAVTGSVSFDGTDDALIIADHGNTFDFLKNDFTVECWIYPRGGASSSFGGIWTKGQSYQLWWKEDTERIEVYASSDGSNYNILNGVNSGDGSAPANQWSHIAHTREGDTFRIFVNGKLLSSATSSATIFANTNAARISDYDPDAGTYELDGEISNLRVLKGTALYTADFTPPTHALEVIKDTVILCCNNPDSVTATAFAGIGTAYAITTAGNPTVATRDPGLTRDFTYGTEFKGVTTFDTQGYFVPPSGTTAERFPDFGAVDAASARGVFAGGYSPGETNIIDYVTISTLGNAQDFGDLTAETEYPAGTSDRTRGLTLGGQTGSDAINTVSFVTIASTGDASDFGDLINALRQKGALANSTRAIAVGGSPTSSPFAANNVMDYFTIQSSGNGLNFGDLTELTNYGNPTASSVRGVFSGMSNPNGSVVTNTISFVTISTTGNALNFGDLDFTGSGGGGLSNSTRGVIARDNNTELDFITIASLGNSQDFGSLTGNARYNTDAAVSSPTRGLFMVGAPVGNTINQIEILSTGDAIDFGDLTRSNGGDAGFSNGHGGLG